MTAPTKSIVALPLATVEMVSRANLIFPFCSAERVLQHRPGLSMNFLRPQRGAQTSRWSSRRRAKRDVESIVTT